MKFNHDNANDEFAADFDDDGDDEEDGVGEGEKNGATTDGTGGGGEETKVGTWDSSDSIPFEFYK